MEEILDDTQEVRDDDVEEEELSVDEVEEEELSVDEVDDESDESFTPTSSALLSPMSKEQIFSGYDDDLPWSDTLMLDTAESEMALRALLQTLITVVRK